MKKYIFKFKEDGKQKRKTIKAESVPEALEELMKTTSGEKLEDINVNCKGEISNDKKKSK